MGINKEEIYKFLNEMAPIQLSEEWDNCGIQINNSINQISKVLLALEINSEIIDEATRECAQLIITHHPLIFSNLKRIDSNDIIGQNIIKLIEGNISVYSSHTNFDRAAGGNNDYFIELLGLKYKLENFDDEFGEIGIGRILVLEEELALKKLIEIIPKKLNIRTYEIRFVGDINSRVSRIGICTGQGVELISKAASLGCQVFITGDVKYHNAQLAKENGISLVDVTHFHSEKIFTENIREKLNNAYKGEIEIIESKVCLNPFEYLINL